MKIAVISDVHGNSLALDKVLEDIFSQKCDEIWCLGDIAMAGYDPNYTIEKIKFLTSEASPVKTRCIFGNTDWMIYNFSEDIFKKVLEAIPCMAYALEDDVRIIKPENIEFLKTLPQNEKITINAALKDVEFYLCHGSPRRVDENIYPDTPLDVLEQMILPANGADVVLCGHTHIPCGFQLSTGQSVVNAGSVGRPMTEDKRALWLLIDIQTQKEQSSSGAVPQYEFVHRFVNYDNKTASTKIRERGFRECDTLADMLLK